MKNIVIVDGNALMHRAYHGVGKGFVPLYEGMPVGMVFGFVSTILSAIDFLSPDILFVTFDTKEKTFRHEADESYKAQREKAPDDFYPQVPYIFEFLENFKIPILKVPGYESDDIIGTIAKKAESIGCRVSILSGDYDFLQLVSDSVKLLKFNGAIEKSIEYGPKETFEKMGVWPNQVIDFKALTGDSSDNYKGVEGLGPKTAAKLLTEYGSISGIFQHLSDIPEKWKMKFEDSRQYIAHCQMLATIHTSVSVEFSLDEVFDFFPESSEAFLKKMKFNSLLGRYKKLVEKKEPRIIQEKEKKIEKPQSNLFGWN